MISDAEVPIIRMPDGRQFITDRDVAEQPHLRAFIDRLSNYWRRDDLRCGWISPAVE